MKKYFVMMMAVMSLCLTACSDKDDEVQLTDLTIQVTGTDNVGGFEVHLTNATTTSAYSAFTDINGKATFKVTPGVYNATVSATRYTEGYRYVFNGTATNITLTAGKVATATIELKEAKSSQVIIKELYNGGCPKDDGKTFQFDKCIILYNNSGEQAVLNNLCIGSVTPGNGHAKNNNYGEDGKLTYASQEFIPAQHGLWWFPAEVTIAPYSQLVLNINGAIDNTQTVSQSVNYANADYYCMYDPESGYNNTNYYPTPSDVIPTTHYLKAKKLGLGNGWTFSVSSPAVFIFQTQGVTPSAFAESADNVWYDGGKEGDAVYACLKVPNKWILDGMEVYASTKVADSQKRLTSDIDAGYVTLTNYMGHTLYRNVDKAATEALAENAGKLVYSYALGVDASTDPSGIDAEASMKNGAHIIFQDTNNSTADFHERQKCSLRN